MKQIYSLITGTTPFVMSIPHLGQEIPDEIAACMTPQARCVPDTDWDLDLLYGFARQFDISIISAHHSRYVVDLNRAPDDAPLYPGANNTGLVPLTTFAEQDIYLPGKSPGADEIARRREAYWQPYHDAIAQRLEDVKNQHGIAVLFDCHSIKSQVPRFFEGKLPDINLGTADGGSCALELERILARELGRDSHYSLAVNGRFKGGYITRHYGLPENRTHAYQIEHSTLAYMDEQPGFEYREAKAVNFRQILRPAMEQAIAWAKSKSTASS